MRRSFLVWAGILGLASAGALLASCGARSQLDAPGGHGEGGSGGGGGSPERDAGKDAPRDRPPDVPMDVPPPFDCVEAGITYVYLMTESNDLLAFYPPDPINVINLGKIQCPAKQGSSPYSMAVDRKGIAYVLFDNSGELFRVSPNGPTCEATSFQPDQHGFHHFGMGFSSDADGPGETLYVAQIDQSQMQPSKGLGKIDVDTFQLDFIGPFSKNFGFAMEMTGTGDAKLYGYMLDNPGTGGHILGIDKTNGDILSVESIGVGNQSDALAFASWGGAFYIFTSGDGATTQVHQWGPGVALNLYTTISGVVVGAGVSTCAPAH